MYAINRSVRRGNSWMVLMLQEYCMSKGQLKHWHVDFRSAAAKSRSTKRMVQTCWKPLNDGMWQPSTGDSDVATIHCISNGSVVHGSITSAPLRNLGLRSSGFFESPSLPAQDLPFKNCRYHSWARAFTTTKKWWFLSQTWRGMWSPPNVDQF